MAEARAVQPVQGLHLTRNHPSAPPLLVIALHQQQDAEAQLAAKILRVGRRLTE